MPYLMVEHSDVEGQTVLVRRAVTPGFGVSFAGTDIAAGETVLRRGELLTSRETGVLAAIGVDRVSVWRKPVVGILSTGDEIIEPGEPMRPGQVYDSNARVLADAVRELGAEPRLLGIVSDDMAQLRERVGAALADCDVLLLSGGTSKGTGDLSYRVVSELLNPGIVAHGVALKPGKPICLAATGGKPVVILPGFPTSAIFTFHEFVAPVIRELGGQPRQTRATVKARLAVKVNSEIGRTEYLLVGLRIATARPAHRTNDSGQNWQPQNWRPFPSAKDPDRSRRSATLMASSPSVGTKRSWRQTRRSTSSYWAAISNWPISWSWAAIASAWITSWAGSATAGCARSFWPSVRRPAWTPSGGGNAISRAATCWIRIRASTTDRFWARSWH